MSARTLYDNSSLVFNTNIFLLSSGLLCHKSCFCKVHGLTDLSIDVPFCIIHTSQYVRAASAIATKQMYQPCTTNECAAADGYKQSFNYAFIINYYNYYYDHHHHYCDLLT